MLRYSTFKNKESIKMARVKSGDKPQKTIFKRLGKKRTTIGGGKMAKSKMNKNKRRNYKPYRGQGIR